MSGWAKTGGGSGCSTGTLGKIHHLFDRAVALYQQGNDDCRPNQFAYATLIHAYAKSKTIEGALQAEQLLQTVAQEYKAQIQQAKVANHQQGVKTKTAASLSSSSSSEFWVVPNTQLVTAAIDCWQKSGAVDAGHRAEALLNWMIEMAEEAEQDLTTMAMAKEMWPNSYSFASAIAAWARTSSPGKATRARQLLVRMSQLYRDGKIDGPPNTYCFTSVINSCAYCRADELEMKSSLEIAIQTYKEMMKSDSTAIPTHVTFSTFLTALRNLVPRGKERTQAAKTVFEAAIQRGQVDPLVVRKTQSAVEDWKDFIPSYCFDKGGAVQADKIPRDWSRNVVT